MSHSNRRFFSEEQKTHIVNLVLDGRTKREVCKDFELDVCLLNRWIKQFETFGSFSNKTNNPPTQAEYNRVCAELRKAREEIRILKRAALILGAK